MSDKTIISKLEKILQFKANTAAINFIYRMGYDKTFTYALDEKNNVIGLNISNFRLLKLPLEIGKLKNLARLVLHNNQLGHISGIALLKKLKFVDLGTNELKELSPLGELTDIAELDLGLNLLTEISALRKL